MELTVERRCLDCIALRVTLGGLPDRGREELVEERDVALLHRDVGSRARAVLLKRQEGRDLHV